LKVIIHNVYSLRGWVLRRSLEAVVVVVVTTMGDAVFMITNGMRNDRRNGSSSKNECNGKFDLNHFLVMKCREEFSDQRKSCVVRCGGMRPAEESGNMGGKAFIPSVPRFRRQQDPKTLSVVTNTISNLYKQLQIKKGASNTVTIPKVKTTESASVITEQKRRIIYLLRNGWLRCHTCDADAAELDLVTRFLKINIETLSGFRVPSSFSVMSWL
jgi:hypothetical protein